jgi:uncharacterized membrane protein
MKFMKALGLGLLISVVALIIIFIATFVSNGSFSIPAFVSVESTTNGSGAPETSMFFNPLGPLALALAVAAVLWLATKAKRTSRQQ